MKTSSAKAKGRRLQKIVARLISVVTGCEHGKDKDIDERPMGQSGPDVILRGRAKELFPYVVECKNTERLNLWAAVKQARSYGDNWIVAAGRNREKPILIMDLETGIKNLAGGNQ